jgi:DNA-binding NarL/FixJ family response regulator
MRFVVADDHPTIREMVRAMLKKLGHTDVVLAADGMEAWPQICLGGPCTVISDIDMPRRNGLELLRDVRCGVENVDRATTFLLLTGHSEHALVGLALALDVDGFLVKPVSPPGLERRLQRALNNRLTPKAAGHYDRVQVPAMISGALASVSLRSSEPPPPASRMVPVAEIAPGMVLSTALMAKSGAEILAAGTAVSPWLSGQLRDLLEMGAIEDGIAVEGR